MIFTKSHAANTWGSVAESQKKGFFDFEFITWMAWTWQTAAFFFIHNFMFCSDGFMGKEKTWWKS